MLTQLPREQKRDGGGGEFWLKQLRPSGSGVMTAALNDNGRQKGEQTCSVRSRTQVNFLNIQRPCLCLQS